MGKGKRAGGDGRGSGRRNGGEECSGGRRGRELKGPLEAIAKYEDAGILDRRMVSGARCCRGPPSQMKQA